MRVDEKYPMKMTPEMETLKFRAEHLTDAATRLDRQAQQLQYEAAAFRSIAAQCEARLNTLKTSKPT